MLARISKTAGLALSLLLAGCWNIQPPDPQVVVIDSGCITFRPIFLAPGEARLLSDRTVAAINNHNETGALRCGWRPAGGEDGDKTGSR